MARLDGSGNLYVRDSEAPATRYPFELTVSTPGTPVTDTFGESVKYISIYADLAVWVDETDTATAGDGATAGRRIYVAPGERRVVPWSGTAIAVVNVVSGESPTVRGEGWA